MKTFAPGEHTRKDRVGYRIKKIRTEKGMTQEELGEKVGLCANRIQQYENGQRTPKSELLENIANALGVSSYALTDPDTTSFIGTMYALFELEALFNVTPQEGTSGVCISIDCHDILFPYVQAWYEKYSATQTALQTAASTEEMNEIIKAYHNWKWNYPTTDVAKQIKKSLLKKKIDTLQAEYDALDDAIDQL